MGIQLASAISVPLRASYHNCKISYTVKAQQLIQPIVLVTTSQLPQCKIKL